MLQAYQYLILINVLHNENALRGDTVLKTLREHNEKK